MDDTQKNINRLQNLVKTVIESDYEILQSAIEEREKRAAFWESLKVLRKEFQSEASEFDAYEFEAWIKEKYGIELNFVDGNIGGDYQVVDEKKYIVYLLKFK